MKRRLALVAGATVVAAGTAYWLVRPTPGSTQAAARRASKIDVREVKPGPAAPGPPGPSPPSPIDKPRMVMTESGLRPMTTGKPRQWIDPVSGAVNREIVDAVPDPAAAAREELAYRKSRLRLTLSDAAAPCWNGGDSHDEIELSYTLVVENEVIRADNVRIKQSKLTDPSVERCITDSVRDMRVPGARLPDLREEQGLTMSLHDLYDRNQRDARNRTKPAAESPEPFDRPTAKPPAD